MKPPLVGAQRDVKEFARGRSRRGWTGQSGDHQVAVARQPVRKQAQNHALAGARFPDGEAAVPALVDAPAEAFDARRGE